MALQNNRGNVGPATIQGSTQAGYKTLGILQAYSVVILLPAVKQVRVQQEDKKLWTVAKRLSASLNQLGDP